MRKYIAQIIIIFALLSIVGCGRKWDNPVDPTVPLDVPVLLSPENNATGINFNPTLSWSAVAGASSYELQVSGDSLFNSFVINEANIKTLSKPVTNLVVGTRYYWRVRAYKVEDFTDWSRVFMFRTTTIYVVGNYLPPSSILSIEIKDSMAYIGTQEHGIRVLNISDVSNIKEIGSYTAITSVQDIFIRQNYAFVTHYPGYLRILDISNPTNITSLSYYNTQGSAQKVYVENNYAYVADGACGLRIIDVSNLLSPYEIGYYMPDTIFYNCVYVSDSYAYVLDYYKGLNIIDVSNPSSCIQVNYFSNNSSYYYDVILNNNYAFLSCIGGPVLDVTDPLNIVQVSSCGNDARYIVINNGYAHVANGSYGISIYNVADPTNVRFIINQPPVAPDRLAVSGNYIFAPIVDFDWGATLRIIYWSGE